jgi:hypothetical protein
MLFMNEPKNRYKHFEIQFNNNNNNNKYLLIEIKI